MTTLEVVIAWRCDVRRPRFVMKDGVLLSVDALDSVLYIASRGGR